jgi:hypothetical protein
MSAGGVRSAVRRRCRGDELPGVGLSRGSGVPEVAAYPQHPVFLGCSGVVGDDEQADVGVIQDAEVAELGAKDAPCPHPCRRRHHGRHQLIRAGGVHVSAGDAAQAVEGYVETGDQGMEGGVVGCAGLAGMKLDEEVCRRGRQLAPPSLRWRYRLRQSEAGYDYRRNN